jgi:hypothetical protein
MKYQKSQDTQKDSILLGYILYPTWAIKSGAQKKATESSLRNNPATTFFYVKEMKLKM